MNLVLRIMPESVSCLCLTTDQLDIPIEKIIEYLLVAKLKTDKSKFLFL